jgi:SAM-dependent methyltransferase
MAHQQQQAFCLRVKKKKPSMFVGKLVLDIGSLDINGNNQYLFEQCGYTGIDLSIGNNVDIVSKGHELKFPDETFDVIISTECFEHDTFYAQTMQNIHRMLKPGAFVRIFLCNDRST